MWRRSEVDVALKWILPKRWGHVAHETDTKGTLALRRLTNQWMNKWVLSRQRRPSDAAGSLADEICNTQCKNGECSPSQA